MPLRDQRKNQRYNLRLPFELIRTGSQLVGKSGETRNLSSGGVLFTSDAEVYVGQPIEFMITLPTNSEGAPVRLRCVGKVVRTEKPEFEAEENQVPSSVAATLERFEFVRNRN
ncbi:MAG: PilZ domain-containing protein [Bryobacteraceae bacterium]|nr:PilZ domain-containing protein [Bryobacteraceae bacterium]